MQCKKFIQISLIVAVSGMVCMLDRNTLCAQMLMPNYTSSQEFFDGMIGSTPRQGLGGIIIPVSPNPVSSSRFNRANPEAILKYVVYRRMVGTTEWQNISEDGVQMARQEDIEKVLGRNAFNDAMRIATGKGIVLNGEEMSIRVGAARKQSKVLSAVQTGDEYYRAIRDIGTIDDITPFLLNARSLPLLGMVFVDTSSVVKTSDVAYEYAVAPVTLIGEGEKVIKGRINPRVAADVKLPAIIDSIHVKYGKQSTNMMWSFMPDQPIYTFAVYRSVRRFHHTLPTGEAEFQLIDHLLARNDSTIVGDGVKRYRYSMRFTDTMSLSANELVEYRIVPQDYLFNPMIATRSKRVLPLIPADIPLLPAPTLRSDQDKVFIDMANLPAAAMIEKIHVQRSDGPDRSYQTIHTFNVADMPTTQIVQYDTLINPQTKQATVQSVTKDVLVEQTVSDEVPPNTVYYYRTQSVLIDGSLSNTSPYKLVYVEYKAKPATLARSAIVALPLDSVYAQKSLYEKRVKTSTSILSTLSAKTVKERTGTYIAWSEPQGEKYTPMGYYVKRSENGEPGFRQVSGLLKTPEFIDTTRGLNQYRKVRYTITTVNVSGVESDESEEVETYPSYTKPLEPPAVNVSAHRSGANEIEVRFYDHTDMKHIDTHYVYRRLSGAKQGEWQKISLKKINAQTFVDTTVKADAAYQYAYSVHDIRGYESSLGSAVDIAEIPTLPQKPIPLQTQNLRVTYQGEKILLRWDPLVHPRLLGYVVVRAGSDKVYEKRADLSRASVIFEESIPLKTLYFYKVIPVFEEMQGLQGDELSVIRYK